MKENNEKKEHTHPRSTHRFNCFKKKKKELNDAHKL